MSIPYLHRIGFVAALVSASLSVLANQSPTRSQSERKQLLSFSLEASSVSLHEPVFVDLSIRNHFTENIRLDLGFNREGNLDFIILEPDGTEVRARRAGGGGFGRSAEVVVGPEEVYRQRVLLNQWYQPAHPGTCRVRLALDSPILKESGAALNVNLSQEMVLQVTPRDPSRLREVCQHLAETAMSPSAEPALDAARALSYVQDLVAAPYLAQLTERGLFTVVMKPIALRGLARIASAEGLSRVVSTLGPADRKLKPEIVAELKTIRPDLGTLN